MNTLESLIAPEAFHPLMPWYREHRRSLPWRETPDPYRVWVSEIMLQQTRVETVIPYFERWMARFPDIRSLAEADQQDVLRLWEGLGYYSRARNLHRAARMVMSEFSGRLPAEPTTLRRLPGIGPYTAGAIASIAFGQDAPVVDGNVRRVLARVLDIDIPVDSAPGARLIQEAAAHILPAGRAGDHNQALMELGALVCSPQSPECTICPLRRICRSRAAGVQLERPVTASKAPVPSMTVAAAVIRQGDKVLITKRPEDGLLGGMWEFPGGKLEDGEDLQACLDREIREELGAGIVVGRKLGVYRHAYTHFRVELHAFECRFRASDPELAALGVAAFRWVQPAELDVYPMGKIDRSISIDIRE